MKKLTFILIFGIAQFFGFGQVLQVNGNLQLTNQSQVVLHNSSISTQNTIQADTGSLIKFAGTQAAEINGSTKLTSGKLEIDNTAGVTLNNDVDVANKLIFSSGIIYTSSSNALTYLQNATSEINSNLSFVNGPITRIGSTDFTFQIGNYNRCFCLLSGFKNLSILI